MMYWPNGQLVHDYSFTLAKAAIRQEEVEDAEQKSINDKMNARKKEFWVGFVIQKQFYPFSRVICFIDWDEFDN